MIAPVFSLKSSGIVHDRLLQINGLADFTEVINRWLLHATLRHLSEPINQHPDLLVIFPDSALASKATPHACCQL